MTDISKLTAAELSAAFANSTLSPLDVAHDVLKRIDDWNPTLNAFSLVDADGALTAARASERRWAKGEARSGLDGVPVTVKDIVWSSDWPTTYGSDVLVSDEPAEADAPCVARLKEAGTVLLGMTTTPELGWKAVTDSPRFGTTCNPWNTDMTTGGSSGGAGAAAALNLGALHIGTDGGGSIRIPSAFCGIAGHKPSFGRVPAYPMSAFGTVAHIGPMARTVQDAALMLDVISRPDPRDWYALPYDGQSFADRLTQDLTGLRIAYSPDLGYMKVAPEVARLVRSAVSAFETLGATVEEVAPIFDDPREIFEMVWFSAAAEKFSDLSAADRKRLDPALATNLETRAGATLAEYLGATRARGDLRARMMQFHQEWDLLVTPTLPFPAFETGRLAPDEGQNWTDWAGFSYPFNLTQQPACTVPCGLTAEGLPVGFQIIGPRFDDAGVLRAAHAFERTRAWDWPACPVTPKVAQNMQTAV